MITRNPIRPHVCLRCQRNLVKGLAPSTPQKASQSTSNSNLEPSNSPREPSRLRIQRVPAIDQRRSLLRKDGRQENHGVKLYGHRGRKLQEIQEDLKTKSLGDAAKVLVLRDSKYNFYTYLNRMKDQEAQHVDIEALLSKERGLVGPDEVNKSINALQERNPPQTWEEMNDVVQFLSQGFTYSQLLGYLEASNKPNTRPEIVDGASGIELEKPFPSRHIINVTSWMPGVSDLSDHFDTDPLRGYYVSSHTSKQKLALKILRECWQWELSEISEGIGQFEIQIGIGDLHLLSKGSNSPLASLHAEYLAHQHEKMEVFRSRGIIRITTMRHKMAIVTDILARELDSIKRETIHLRELCPKTIKGRSFKEWQEQTFDDGALEELGHITNTDISRISMDTLLISSFGEDENSGPSSRIDTVRRLLVTASNAADKTPSTVKCSNIVDGMFIKYPHVEGLDWREKMREWVRWTAPVFKDVEDKQVAGEIVYTQDETTEHQVIDHSKDSNKPPILTNTSSWWSDFKETSAVFGSVLHTSTSPITDIVKPFDSGVTVRRGFSSLIPNLSRSVQKMKFPDTSSKLLPTTTPFRYITVRFLPDPFQASLQIKDVESEIGERKVSPGIGSVVLQQLPGIEMRFSILEDNSTKLKDVLAVLHESTTDVMLPSNEVDIRFQDRTTRRLKHSKNIEALRDFVSKSTFDLQKGRMVTPPSMKFPIDPDILSTHSREVLKLGTQTRNINYMFAGLDVRSTLVFNWNGWRVLYTSIEAGQAGGRRGELKLRPIVGRRVTNKQDFMKAAHELAHELGGSQFAFDLASGLRTEYVKLQEQAFGDDTSAKDSPKAPASGVNRRDVGREESTGLGNEGGDRPWVINELWYDEPWDEDGESSFDLDEVPKQTEEERRGSKFDDGSPRPRM